MTKLKSYKVGDKYLVVKDHLNSKHNGKTVEVAKVLIDGMFEDKDGYIFNSFDKLKLVKEKKKPVKKQIVIRPNEVFAIAGNEMPMLGIIPTRAEKILTKFIIKNGQYSIVFTKNAQGRITVLDKLSANNNDLEFEDEVKEFVFKNSKPEVLEAIGKLLIEASHTQL